ncbi:MAG TPA: UDP-N-acetylglucosamine 1-carboxyvinyltransferase [Candidatus Omnitrophota bacterium]|nr:UDP-N-acetylglucosamine 1-carboxyvinyltransferase [Candidatus Omnitrophota bacterium]
MDKLVIEGGRRLSGEVRISGAKNSALPIMAATLLTDQPCTIHNVPKLRDTLTMIKLLESLGKVTRYEKGKLVVLGKGPIKDTAPYDLVSTMRGSFCVLGPLLGKLRRARVSLPGGCVIGIRPVDLHVKGLKALGAEMTTDAGYIVAKAKRLRGARIYLGGVFGSSVLATANVMMAAVLANGETIIESAACEPEIEDLGNFLVRMGAHVIGHGTPRIIIRGVKELLGADHSIIADRIEAGTFILMSVATRSDLTIRDAYHGHLLSLIDVLESIGVRFEYTDDVIRVINRRTITPASINTYPYPGFPTDLQAQFMALMATTPGVSVITDRVYPDRFMHIAELDRMGANIRREGLHAIVQGVKTLHGAPVMASDLRASAALVIAGLTAKGLTEIHRIYHLERGYEDLEKKLLNIGAKISRKKV